MSTLLYRSLFIYSSQSHNAYAAHSDECEYAHQQHTFITFLTQVTAEWFAFWSSAFANGVQCCNCAWLRCIFAFLLTRELRFDVHVIVLLTRCITIVDSFHLLFRKVKRDQHLSFEARAVCTCSLTNWRQTQIHFFLSNFLPLHIHLCKSTSTFICCFFFDTKTN